MVTLAICSFALMANRMRFREVDHLWQTALFSLILVSVEGMTRSGLGPKSGDKHRMTRPPCKLDPHL